MQADLPAQFLQHGGEGRRRKVPFLEALTRDPRNLAAIAGEGEALMEKVAVEKARENLAKLESLCGESCMETRALSVRIAEGPPVRVKTAEAVLPEADQPQSN